MKNIIITGCAGFIGFHLSKKLIQYKKINIIGIDNLNNYYSQKLKKDRLKVLLKDSSSNKNFFFSNNDLKNKKNIDKIFNKYKPDIVINLAAQAGVRYSISHPEIYLNDNVLSFLNILELSRKYNVKRVIYASTSSVYGSNSTPFSEAQITDNQIQFYAVTKKTNELMAHTWSSIYGVETIGLRFFTVYGPWGRPDMSLYYFTKNIYNGKKIDLFNYGDHIRDFTYIDDIINGINRCINFKFDKLNKKNKAVVPSLIFNLGSGKNIKLKKFIEIIEDNLGKKALVELLPMQIGDIHSSLADLSFSKRILGYKPKIDPVIGIKRFIKWYKAYHQLS